jgi:hypothetical protein
MSNLNNALFASMLKLVKGSEADAVKVLGYKEVEKSDGYCETCYYEYVEVEISYQKSDGTTGVYSYYGDFGDLIRTLTSND